MNYEYGFTKVGEITLNNNVVVSDPCYEIDTWCALNIGNMQSGKYSVIINYLPDEITNWGDRVGSLIVIKDEDYLEDLLESSNLLGEVGVDSGQMSVYNYEEYTNNEERYDSICHKTNHKEAGVVNNGAVSNTGFGDGFYPVYSIIDEETCEVIGLEIQFISEDELDEEDEE